jgi:hypothetical protein
MIKNPAVVAPPRLCRDPVRDTSRVVVDDGVLADRILAHGIDRLPASTAAGDHGEYIDALEQLGDVRTADCKASASGIYFFGCLAAAVSAICLMRMSR